MLRTVPYQLAVGQPGQSRLHIPFGIQPLHKDAVACDYGRKGDEVFLFHRVARGYIPIVFYSFHAQLVTLRRLCGLYRQKLLAAAADGSLRFRCNYVAAARANVKI